MPKNNQPHNSPEHIPRPAEIDPHAIVENTFHHYLPNAGDQLNIPDIASSDVATDFLWRRFSSQNVGHATYTLVPTGKHWPRVGRIPDGVKESHRIERDGWLISPKVAVLATLAGLAIVNGVQMHKDTLEEARIELHQADRAIHGPDFQANTVWKVVTVDTPNEIIRGYVPSPNQAGSSTVDQEAINRFTSLVKAKKGKDGQVSIEVIGRSSDDYGTNDSIGKAEEPESDMSGDRAAAYKDALEEVFPDANITTSERQSVLTAQEKSEIEKVARKAGYDGANNIIDAIHDVESGNIATNSAIDDSDGKLKKMIDKLFTKKRGVALVATIDNPGQKIAIPVPEITLSEVPDNPPEDKNHSYYPFLVPPIPRFRRVFDKNVPKRKWAIIPGEKRYKLKILRERQDQEWVQIRPEAVQDDGTLVDAPWAYTPKYEHLMRDGRIVDLLRADYRTKSGEDKSIRIMFIDKSPSQEEIDYYSNLLKVFAQIQDGAIANRISGIFVYPSSSAGTYHNDPKSVALGQSKQAHESVLGSYTPLLDLVEMHRPHTWDPDAANAMLESFFGPGWTMAHEVAGHGSDDTDAKLRLIPVRALAGGRGIHNPHIVDGDPWADKMRPTDRQQYDLPKELAAPIQYDIEYTVQDNSGQSKIIKTRVPEGDPRLSHSLNTTIVGYKPTQYGSTDSIENYAETTASMATGITIPFSEAGTTVQPIFDAQGEPMDFADGYRPDKQGQDVVATSTGAIKGEFPLAFKSPVAVDIRHINPANDKLIREQAIRTRKTHFPRPNELISVLTRSTTRKG